MFFKTITCENSVFKHFRDILGMSAHASAHAPAHAQLPAHAQAQNLRMQVCFESLKREIVAPIGLRMHPRMQANPAHAPGHAPRMHKN